MMAIIQVERDAIRKEGWQQSYAPSLAGAFVHVIDWCPWIFTRQWYLHQHGAPESGKRGAPSGHNFVRPAP